MMDTEALWQAVAAYGNARWRGVKFEQDAADHLSEIKAILNRAEAETRELLATNERLVDEVAELKAAYESQFKELHELKAKLTDKASLLRGCYAADHKQKQRIEELIAELEAEREESKRWLVKAQNERDARKELEAELERIKALEPVAYARFTPNGNIRIWARTHAEAIAGNLPEAPPMTALYALGSKTA